MNYENSVMNESSLTRVWQQTLKFDSGTITAFRNDGDCGRAPIEEKYTKNQNLARNKILRSKLLRAGYSVTKIKGVYIENYKSDHEINVKEEVFLVIDHKNTGDLKRDLIKLGTEFEQDSITYSKASGEYYSISTNKCPEGWPGKGKIGVELKLGKSMFGKDGMIYSRVNGRPFIFESLLEQTKIMEDYTIAEIRGIIYHSNLDCKNICKLNS